MPSFPHSETPLVLRRFPFSGRLLRYGTQTFILILNVRLVNDRPGNFQEFFPKILKNFPLSVRIFWVFRHFWLLSEGI